LNDRVRRRLGTTIAAVVVVALALSALYRVEREPLPDFSAIDTVAARKAAFFAFLAPIVVEENARVLAQRQRLLEIESRIASGDPLSPAERRWLRSLAAEYGLQWPGDSRAETLATLARRVDVVPEPLALVQAAKESGWGRSRFAREANNLFGHWCYSPGCGVVPAQRRAGMNHEVAAFDSVRQSVRRYINNLNSHDSYRPLREIRAAERAAGRFPRALALADGLVRYSERRAAYVEEIKQIIRANRGLIQDALAGASIDRAGPARQG